MHAVIDQFAPPELLRAVAANWLAPDSGHWHAYENGKLATKDPARLPTAARLLLGRMAELPVEKLLGVDETFPDLEYLHGAGLHQMNAGGDLGLHTDSERHPLLPWRREISAVLYVDDAAGGELELWTDPAGEMTDRIEARKNRLVLFTTPGQWHRVAKCRSTRRSLCLFFWSLREGGSATTATFA